MLRSHIYHFNNLSFHKNLCEKIANDSITKNEISKHRILIVNANEYSKDIQTQFLDDMGFIDIDFADGDKQLAELINKHAYSIIIFEFLSFNSKTLSICKLIRNNQKNKNTIILSATYMHEDTLNKCNEYDMNGIIIKPFIFNMYKKSLCFHLSNSKYNRIKSIY